MTHNCSTDGVVVRSEGVCYYRSLSRPDREGHRRCTLTPPKGLWGVDTYNTKTRTLDLGLTDLILLLRR